MSEVKYLLGMSVGKIIKQSSSIYPWHDTLYIGPITFVAKHCLPQGFAILFISQKAISGKVIGCLVKTHRQGSEHSSSSLKKNMSVRGI